MKLKQVLAIVSAPAAIAGLFFMLAPDREKPAMAREAAGPSYVQGEVLVQFKTATSSDQRHAAMRSVGGVNVEHIRTRSMRDNFEPGITVVRIAASVPQAIAALRNNPAVEFAEPNWIYTHQAVSNDNHYMNGNLWGMYGSTTTPANQYGSHAANAWAAGNTGSSTVYVGVIDEGIMTTHEDLAANVWSNDQFDPVNGVDDDHNGYVDDTNGWDFVGNNNSVFDGVGDDHATHVAGTIGGVGGNGIGVAGVNWSVKMISCKFLGSSGGTTENAIRAVDYITDLKIRHRLNIVATNNSWGGGGFSQGLYDAIKRANDANILFCAAAGNSGVSSASYPAAYDNANVISVAALTFTGGLASYSNYGASSVDLGAPGSGVVSCVPQKRGNKITSSYASYSGTSMACPHVTGAAALYRSTHPTASAADIKAAILGSAVATASLNNNGSTNMTTWKCVTGGRLNVSGF